MQANSDLDARSDLYSLGVVFYELITGRKLFDSESQFDVMLAHVETLPDPPSKWNPQVTTELDALILTIQHDLFTLGADLATPEERDLSKGRVKIERVEAPRVDRLEAAIDRYEAELPPLTRFILPGGHPLAAALHISRVVCRRAERRCITLASTVLQSGQEAPINPEVIRYLNRLSDLLFVLARVANHRHRVDDIVWNPLI